MVMPLAVELIDRVWMILGNTRMTAIHTKLSESNLKQIKDAPDEEISFE